MMTPVRMVKSMDSAQNVATDIKLEKGKCALLHSRLTTAKEEGEMSAKVAEVGKGPRLFGEKRKGEELYAPRYRRGFVWSSQVHNSISPSVLNTETAALLPSLPADLLNNPHIQQSIESMHQEKPV